MTVSYLRLNMHYDFLIIGQGLAGTLLSYELIKAGKSVHVIHDPLPLKASMAAGGLINPFSSRDWTRMKSQETYLPVALNTYRQAEQLLGVSLLQQSSMLVLHEQEEKRQLFEEKKTIFPDQLQQVTEADQQKWLNMFHIPHDMGKVQPLYIADAATLLQQWRNYLQQRECFTAAVFGFDSLEIHADHIRWQQISAGQIIFCEGSTARVNPLFPGLPFTRNRGEALLISIPDLPLAHIYHHNLRLVPRSDGLFWCGSNYKWVYTDLEPDQEWRAATSRRLQQWLKCPFHIADHLVAERPTTAGQNVLTLKHPKYSRVSLFNGLGTRGFSSGPYYASLFARTLCSRN